MKFSAIDLFSGCGGLTQGLKQADFQVIGGVELDEAAAATYRLNHPEVGLLQKDIRAVKVRKWMKQLDVRPGDVSLLAGCPPCQGYSALRTKNGRKQNRDERNTLVREMLRFAKALRPRAVMMENVPGLQGKLALRELRVGLEQIGYHVRCDVRDAQFYGVPQRRRRLILLAGRGFEIPFAQPRKNSLTVRKSLVGLRRVGTSGDKLHDFAEHRNPKIKKLISQIPLNGGSRSALGKVNQLRCHKNCDGFKDIYGRMAWSQKSPTITSGCFNPSKGRFLHPRSNRCITMREAAILQGFPRRYKFDSGAGKQAVALMIGNALPPEFIRRHAKKIRKAIESHSDNRRTNVHARNREKAAR